jgi:exopolyphosphatase/pppGpp-phosphohydrolase
MARPMILMKENLLAVLHNKHKEGVKYDTLIKNYNLKITGPTLKKLIKYYEIMLKNEGEVKTTVCNSLFPDWLVYNTIKEDVQHQPTGWIYDGNMPLGVWKENKR